MEVEPPGIRSRTPVNFAVVAERMRDHDEVVCGALLTRVSELAEWVSEAADKADPPRGVDAVDLRNWTREMHELAESYCRVAAEPPEDDR